MSIQSVWSWDTDACGWLRGCTQIPSPNCDARPDLPEEAEVPDLVVIHHISLPPNQYGGKGVSALFTNQLNPVDHPYYAQIASLRVSAHFFIRRTGELQQFVATTMRAWHAGASEFMGRTRCNDFSLGIELEGSDFEPFTEAQYECLQPLLKVLAQRHPLRYIAGHRDIAPLRKTDPGPYFDWPRVLRDSDLIYPFLLPEQSTN